MSRSRIGLPERAFSVFVASAARDMYWFIFSTVRQSMFMLPAVWITQGYAELAVFDFRTWQLTVSEKHVVGRQCPVRVRGEVHWMDSANDTVASERQGQAYQRDTSCYRWDIAVQTERFSIISFLVADKVSNYFPSSELQWATCRLHENTTMSFGLQ